MYIVDILSMSFMTNVIMKIMIYSYSEKWHATLKKEVLFRLISKLQPNLDLTYYTGTF